MPNLSPPIASPPEDSTTDQVQFLLDLRAASQAIGPYQSTQQARFRFPSDLEEHGITVRFTKKLVNKKNQRYDRTIQIGNRLVFTSFGSKARSFERCNVWRLSCFFKCLQILIQNAQTGTNFVMLQGLQILFSCTLSLISVLSKQAFDSCPITQLQFIEKSVLSNDRIQIKQIDKLVAILILDNAVLSAEGASQWEAAKEMVAMLGRLIQKQASMSLNASNCQQQTAISIFTVTPTLTKGSVSMAIVFFKPDNNLGQLINPIET